jgi:hypothetical protein
MVAVPLKDVPDEQTCYAFRNDTIGSRGFITAVTRTAGPRSFGGAGLCAGRWLGGRDSG